MFDFWLGKSETVSWVGAESEEAAKGVILKLKTGESKQLSVFKKLSAELEFTY